MMLVGSKTPYGPAPASYGCGRAATRWSGGAAIGANVRPPSVETYSVMALYQHGSYCCCGHIPGCPCPWYSLWTRAYTVCPSSVYSAANRDRSVYRDGSERWADDR